MISKRYLPYLATYHCIGLYTNDVIGTSSVSVFVSTQGFTFRILRLAWSRLARVKPMQVGEQDTLCRTASKQCKISTMKQGQVGAKLIHR